MKYSTSDFFRGKFGRCLSVFIATYIILISIIEHVLKWMLETSINISHVYFLINTLVLTILFATFVLIFCIFSIDKSLRDSVRHVSSIFWLFVLSPIITFGVGGTISALNIVGLNDMLNILLFRTDTNIGLIIIYPIVLGFAVKIFKDQNTSVFKNTLRSVLFLVFSLSAYLLLYSQMSLPLFDRICGDNLVYYLHVNFLFCFLLFELVLTMLLTLFIFKKKILLALFSSIKPFRTLHFMVMTVIGFVILSQMDNYGQNFLDILNIPFILLAPICMVFTWQFTTMLNDIYDRDIDRLVHPKRPLVRKKISLQNYWNLAIAFAMGSLYISLLFGLPLMLLNFTFMIAAIMYSIPPVRLKERIYGYVCVGYASVVAFLFGVYSFLIWKISIQLGIISAFRHIPIFVDVFSISLIIFIVLSIAPYINALPDYEGDKKSGVKSIYTIYGLEKGKNIVTVLIILLFLSPLSLIHQPIDFLVIVPASLIAGWIFYAYEKHRQIFMLYFMVLVFVLLRYIEYI